MEKVLLTIPEVATALSLGRATLYVLIQRGELPVIKIGRATRLRASDVRAWADRQGIEAGASLPDAP